MRSPRRITIDAELHDEDYELLFEAVTEQVDALTENFDISGGPSPADARYPHPLGWATA